LKTQHITAPEDKIPVPQKIGYGIGAIVTVISTTAIANLISLFFNIGLGINPALLGIAIALPRIWDGVTDPLVGSISDNTRSRFGRRLPYILIGGILVGIVFAMLWMAPRDWSKEAIFAYFLVISLMFYTATTIFSVPHGALGLEMTNDYHERTRLFAYAGFFVNVAALAPPWFYWIANRNFFQDEVEGIKWVGICVGISLIAAAIVCVYICKEPKFQQAKTQEKINVWESFATTCKNKIFLRLVIIVVMVTVGFHLVTGFANYITIYYLYAGDKGAASSLLALNGTVWAITAILAVFPMTWISERLGKAKTVQIFLVIMGAGSLLKWLCYSPTYPLLTLIPTLMLSAGMLVLYSLVNAMNADICDEDEIKTGKRREGSYNAAYGWWSKVGMSLAALISGFLLNATGFDAELPTQAASTLYWIRFWEIGLPAVLCFVSVWLLAHYPLTEARAYEIKALLEQRREFQSATRE
jgi:GPH family glycoside/pentoside/hexuronide:cation symporter